jgi:MFS superfamily sulfate permease-like transporter
MTKRHELTCLQEIQSFFFFWDERFEDYAKANKAACLFRDFTAGLVVALVAIPLGIGFSIASGLRPEQGIIAGAYAGLLGGIFGGSKYQVYGPTAAFIPIILGIVTKYDYNFLILSSLIAGILIMLLGVFRLGKYFNFVPHSIIVGFTMGIAFTIMVSQFPNILGETNPPGKHVADKLLHVPQMFKDAHAHALVLAVFTFFFVKIMNRISVLIPAALLAMILCTFIANQIWHDHLIPVVATQYGDIGKNMFAFTPPSLGRGEVTDLIVPVLSITFIGALESLLSSRMADRLANNHTPYHPNKELFGQGLVNAVVPLFNGFPCTGALARTATNIKVGAMSPMASIFKGSAVIVLMVFCATYLSSVPMAFVGGLLVYVASNMVKVHEVKLVMKAGHLHIFLMFWTAVMTLLTDLSIAVVSATVLYYAIKTLLEKFAPNVRFEHYDHALGSHTDPKPHLPILIVCPNCGFDLTNPSAPHQHPTPSVTASPSASSGATSSAPSPSSNKPELPASGNT